MITAKQNNLTRPQQRICDWHYFYPRIGRAAPVPDFYVPLRAEPPSILPGMAIGMGSLHAALSFRRLLRISAAFSNSHVLFFRIAVAHADFSLCFHSAA